jgi:hypothetical protein
MSSQTLNNTRFTAEAAEWDANLKHVESTKNAFDAIRRYVPAFKDGRKKGKFYNSSNYTFLNAGIEPRF